MEIKLRSDLSTSNPDVAPALAARGDYMEDSLVGTSVDEALQGVRDETDEYDQQEALETLHERLIHRGHYGPYEHAQAVFVVEGVSRTCMAQVTRHRHMSFDVQSMRYCNFEDAEPKIPPTFNQKDLEQELIDHWMDSLERYNHALEQGARKEDARFFLPLATKVNMTFSANSRMLMHFIDMRDAGDAQWEAERFAKQILDEVEDWAPITFDNYVQHAKGASKKAP